MSALCVVCGATNYFDSKDTARLFRFPSPLLHPEKRAAWVAAVRRVHPDGSLWEPLGDCHICSAHFVTGRPSNFKDRPDFVPTVFNRSRAPGDTALQPYNFCVERQEGEGAALVGEDIHCQFRATEDIWFKCCFCGYVTTDQHEIISHLASHVEDDKVYQVYWAGDARTKGSFYDAKVLYMAVEDDKVYQVYWAGDARTKGSFYDAKVLYMADLNKISDYKVSVTPHRTLNSCQGVISEDDLLESSEEEILEGLSGQGVVAVRRIFIRRDGQERPLKHLVLTFASTVLPENIKAGYLHCKVRPYIPNPRRCFKCQRYGHSSVTCRGKTTCAKCGATDHPADTCEGTLLKCVNCSGAHPTYSRACPKFQEEKKILTLKIKENLTYPEARKRFSFLQGGTYAEAAARGAAPPLKATVGTQYSLRDLECSPSPPTTSEASVGSQTPAALPKAPRARTVPHRPGPKPRVVLDTTPSQSSEGPTPSTSQREEEAMQVSVDPTEPPPPAKGGTKHTPEKGDQKKKLPRVTAPSVP
ncbi:zinc finger protein OZF [Ixodes scapularis]